jgi:hypothetical protein
VVLVGSDQVALVFIYSLGISVEHSSGYLSNILARPCRTPLQGDHEYSWGYLSNILRGAPSKVLAKSIRPLSTSDTSKAALDFCGCGGSNLNGEDVVLIV